LIIMAPKKKGPSMLESQRRKLMMQKIAKGGVQKSGVKKPAPAAGPTKADAKSWQKMNQLGSAKSAKAAEPKPRTPAPGTGNVLKAAQQFSKDKAAKDRQVNRGVAAFRAKMNQSMVGKAAALVGGLRGGAAKAVAETVAPRPTAKGTLVEEVLAPQCLSVSWNRAMLPKNARHEPRTKPAKRLLVPLPLLLTRPSPLTPRLRMLVVPRLAPLPGVVRNIPPR